MFELLIVFGRLLAAAFCRLSNQLAETCRAIEATANPRRDMRLAFGSDVAHRLLWKTVLRPPIDWNPFPDGVGVDSSGRNSTNVLSQRF